jgi:hypothetical protein
MIIQAPLITQLLVNYHFNFQPPKDQIMPNKLRLTAEIFRKFYIYDPASGAIISKITDPSRSVRAGDRLKLWADGKGYLLAWIEGHRYYVHQLAFLYMTGEFLARGLEPDHINRVPSDNTWANLRAVSHAENCLNRKTYTSNTSGIKGISWDSNRKLWFAKITINKKQINLGRFATKEEAMAARVVATAKYHGEYAVQG